MIYVIAFFVLLTGLALGTVCGYLLAGSRLDKELTAAEVQYAALAERLNNREQAIAEANAHRANTEVELTNLRQRENALSMQLGQFQVALDRERKHAAEKLGILNDAQLKLQAAFKALAADALNSNNQAFLQLANTSLERFQETAKGDLDKRQEAIDNLVKPVAESLTKVDEKLQEIEKTRIDAYRSITEQVKALSDTHKDLRTETATLVQALRTPTVRGRWGEIQLRRVVELAGMLAHCDFYEQQSIDSDDGKIRPDVTIRLPGSKNVVVDSKVPLAAFLEALECTDEPTRKEKYRKHAQLVRGHITALSRKSYFEHMGTTPEFVVLFMPGEVFFSAALEHDPGLIEAGVDQNVIIATPTTLIALLRAVAYGWRQEKLAENAKQISDLGKDLYKRLSSMGEHLNAVGKSLGKATESYNKAIGSIETRVMVTARRFSDLDVSTLSPLENLLPIEHVPRIVEATELLISTPAIAEEGTEMAPITS